MRVFFDTSSLFKLYHKEQGTVEIESWFSTTKITSIFLSKISKVEFASTVWKKVRMNEINQVKAQIILDSFEDDFEKYTFILTDSAIIEQAKRLISKYGNEGLRTLNSIQLSTSLSLHKQADLFYTSDKLLKKIFTSEGLPTALPDTKTT
jgi:uncharacterized protein